MKPIPLTAWIPLARHANFQLDGEQKRGDLYRDALPPLVEQAVDSLRLLQPGIGFLSARIARPPPSVENVLASLRPALYRTGTDHLRIDAQAPADMPVSEDMTQAERKAHRPQVAALLVAEAIEQLLMCTELAFPSLFDADPGIVRYGARGVQRLEPKSSIHSLRFVTPHGIGWPAIADLPLRQVVQWLATKTAYLTRALPTNRVERTLAAYTHVVGLTQHRDGETLFRAMQGLEAFYCDGIGDLRKQLSDKTAIWLGPPPVTKNLVGKLYEIRSKFIHGSAPFAYFGSPMGAYDEDEKGQLAQDTATDFAVHLLVATLQRCIRDGVSDLSWSFQVNV